MGDAGELAAGDLAGVGFDFGGENSEECGFTRAIGTNKADAIGFADGERDVVEEPRYAE